MPSLERLPSGRWRVRWRTGGRGSRTAKSHSVATKAEAYALRAEISAQLAAQAPPRPGQPESLATLARAWAHARAAEGRDPDHTAGDLDRLLALLRRHAWTDLVELTPAHVDQARTMRAPPRLAGLRRTGDDGGQPRAIPRPWSARAGALLATCLRWAADHRDARVDARALRALRPGRIPRRPHPRDLVAPATVEAWQRTAAAISPDCAALVHCLCLYGWRPITAGRLRVADADLDRLVLRAPVKGGDVIEHPLVPATAALLAGLVAGRAATDPLFRDPRTGRAFAHTGSYSVAAWWRTYLGGRSYDAKRWAISRLMARAQPHEVARVTGHRCPQVLYRYATTDADRTRDLLAAVSADPAPAMGAPWAHRGHQPAPAAQADPPKQRKKQG